MRLSRFVISKYGVANVTPEKCVGRQSIIKAYELEFYTEDCEGGRIIDDVFQPVRKHYYSLARPGQRQRLMPPYRCWFINFVTTDPELCEFFEDLPDSGPVWDMDGVVALMRELLEVQDRRSMAGQLWMEGCASKLLSLLSQQMRTDEPTRRGAFRHRDTLRMVDRYIKEHLAEDLTLERLGALANLEPTYLQKLFAAAYGQTPAQRVQALRITQARIALTEEDTSVGEIAERLGFSSQAYFTSIFKKVMHHTPTEFRMLHRRREGQ